MLDLISTGAPLPRVLDEVCTSLNVVFLVIREQYQEHYIPHLHVHTIANTVAEFGLSAFSRTAILSPSEELFGTFEIYCCFPRTPAFDEDRLIQRATHPAALAIEHRCRVRDSGNFSLHWNDSIDSGCREEPPSRN